MNEFSNLDMFLYAFYIASLMLTSLIIYLTPIIFLIKKIFNLLRIKLSQYHIFILFNLFLVYSIRYYVNLEHRINFFIKVDNLMIDLIYNFWIYLIYILWNLFYYLILNRNTKY